LYFDVTVAAGLAETPRLLPELVARFRAMIPLVEFFNRPLLKKAGQIRLTPL
jgi:hypothetical protein